MTRHRRRGPTPAPRERFARQRDSLLGPQHRIPIAELLALATRAVASARVSPPRVHSRGDDTWTGCEGCSRAHPRQRKSKWHLVETSSLTLIPWVQNMNGGKGRHHSNGGHESNLKEVTFQRCRLDTMIVANTRMGSPEAATTAGTTSVALSHQISGHGPTCSGSHPISSRRLTEAALSRARPIMGHPNLTAVGNRTTGPQVLVQKGPLQHWATNISSQDHA